VNQTILRLAREAGIGFSEELLPVAERAGIRSFCANMSELTKFAQLVGQVARDDERKKLSPSTRRDDTSE